MNIITYLNHSQVNAWRFTSEHACIIKARLPEADIRICGTEEELLAALPDADAVLTWTFKQPWLDLAPRLRVLSTPAAGKDYFHVNPPGNVVMLNGHFHGEIIAETVVGMLLGIVRGLLPNATTFAQLPWGRRELEPVMGTLRHAIITILGFGHIGQWIGKLLKPFGTTIWGMTRHGDAPRPSWFDADDCIFTLKDLDRRLAATDHLVLALPASPETDNLMDGRRLDLLPQTATVTNIGRGNAIDETALMQRLTAGMLRGAVLDVFKQEPLLAENPLRCCPNLWTLPHASAIAPQYLSLYAAEVAEELAALKAAGRLA